LLEMSRQRLRESNVKWSIRLTSDSMALKILKTLEIKSIENNAKIVDLTSSVKICNYIYENFSESIEYFQKKNKIKINISSNLEYNNQEYLLEFKSKTKKILNKIENVEKLIKKTEDKHIASKIKTQKKKKFKKAKFIKRKRVSQKTI
jgi:ribonuclease E